MNNKEIVNAWYSALEINDFDTIKNLMDSSYQLRHPMSSNPISAKEHLAMMETMKSSFEAHHEFDVFIEDEDYVVVSGKWMARHTGNFNGISGTGKLIELQLIDIFRFNDGKVVYHHIEFNPMLIMAQIAETTT
jgi:predicted ester cyclase